MGHFGIYCQSRDLSLSQPFWDILATMAYKGSARVIEIPSFFGDVGKKEPL